jgi:hypothetical protein
MTRRVFAFALLAVLAGASLADAGGPLYHVPRRWVAARYPWHGAYYDPAWGGAPTALVVPPTASLQTKWAWGVTNTDVVPIYSQFGRQYPGAYYGAYGYRPYGFIPTPPIPGSTDEFGVYYVRGPW